MGLMDKFKNFMNVSDEDYDYEDEDESGFFAADEQPVSSPHMGDGSRNRGSNKVVNIHATTQLQVVLVKPEMFEDARAIADHLNAKRTVVLNLESANREVARRLIDFLSGVAYANDGQIKKVANSTFIITPYNVGIMGANLLDELESSGVFF